MFISSFNVTFDASQAEFPCVTGDDGKPLVRVLSLADARSCFVLWSSKRRFEKVCRLVVPCVYFAGLNLWANAACSRPCRFAATLGRPLSRSFVAREGCARKEGANCKPIIGGRV